MTVTIKRASPCYLLYFALCMLMGTGNGYAQTEQSRASPPSRSKVGLVLSGGGARGAAHIGVIKELERLRVPIDVIAGTSMGSIIGGLYASGMTPSEMENALAGIDWDNIFKDQSDRANLSVRRKQDQAFFLFNKRAGIKEGRLRLPSGAVQGQKLYLKLKELTLAVADVTDFDRLAIPYRAVASDIATGETVALGSGDLANAMRASMSIPGFISPVTIDGRLLVDGGISNNIPVDVARSMGAEVVIVVDISSPLLPQDRLNTLFTIVYQLTGILTRRNAEQQLATLGSNDILIVPDLKQIGSGDFKLAMDAVPIGRDAARKMTAALQRLSLGEAEYSAHVAARGSRMQRNPIIEFVRLENQSGISDEVIRARLRIEPGRPLDIEELEQNVASIYGLDLFENVGYELVEESGRTGLLIKVKERPFGPNYLQFGVRFSTDFLEDSRFAVRLGWLRTPINRLNAEWRTVLELGDELLLSSELYQPLRLKSPYFVLPRLFANRKRFNILEDGEIIAEERIREWGVSLAAGREFGTWGQLQFGILRAAGDVETRVGPPDLTADEFDSGEVFARLGFDTLDNIFFPRGGAFGSFRWGRSLDELGADVEFQQAGMKLFGARSRGPNTFSLGLRYFITYSGEAPIPDRVRLGGLFALPGFADDELSGQQLLLLRLGYMRAIGQVASFPAYWGLTLQQGNVFEDDDDIDLSNTLTAGSVFLGLETLLGPLYTGYGHAEGGHDSLYFLLGRQF